MSELLRIDRSHEWHSLSRAAWGRQCIELAGVDDIARLEGLWAEIQAKAPVLAGEIAILGRRWATPPVQDRPALSPIFSQHGHDPRSYAERLAGGWSAEVCSACAAMLAGEQRPSSSFGQLGDFAELEAATAPLVAELAEVDRLLAEELRLQDLIWRPGGWALELAGAVIPITPDVLGAGITRIAFDVARRLPTAEAAAA